MLEDQLYFTILHHRLMSDENWRKGPRHFFDDAPAVAARERIRAVLYGQGLGRHSDAEIADLAGRSLAALAAILGDKPCLFGEAPCGADATAFAMVAGVTGPCISARKASPT
jgi:glutathione S-transferase